MQPGSLVWLLRFELLLWWREIKGRPAARLLLGLLAGLVALVTVALGLFLRLALRAAQNESFPFPWIWLAAMAFVGLFFMTGVAAVPVTLAGLFDRRDLDLLLSSPIANRTVLAGRLLGITLQLFGNFLWFVLPYSLLVVAFGVPQLLGIYPGLGGICLLCACWATLGLLGLVRLVGLARARAIAQGILVALSLAIFAGIQWGRIWVARGGTQRLEALSERAVEAPWLGSESWLWFPARTLAGHPGAILLWLGLCGGAAALTVRAMERNFLLGGQQAAIAAGRSPLPAASWRFRRNLTWILLAKEWRLLWRQPTLFSQVGTQLAILGTYTLVYLSDPDFRVDPSLVLAIAQTGFSHTIGGILMRLTIRSEVAPALLKSSPRSTLRLAAIKLVAALLPTWALLSPLAAIALWRGEGWLAPTLTGMAASGFAGFLSLCGTRAPIRDELLQQQEGAYQRQDLVVVFLSLLSASLWMAIALMGARGWWLGSLLCWPPLGILGAIAYGRGRQTDTLSQF